MFHTYVLAASGNPVDFDRASYLMDKSLLSDAIKARDEERDGPLRRDADYGAQWVWGYYCSRHREKYGEGFEPDIDPTWDRPSPPLVEKKGRAEDAAAYSEKDIRVLRA